jgi:2Fe-2S ferredoxin
MPTITFESSDNSRREVQAPNGTTLMEIAVKSGIEGIEAECGGTCSCATCHVYVDERFVGALPPPASDEIEMLDFVADERKPNSRLSCQIVVDPALEGMVVRLPEKQCM